MSLDPDTEKLVIVVPCYNEAKRLKLDSFKAATDHYGIRFIFVDDGSTDDTAQMIKARIANDSLAWEVFSLQVNQGKAEAVRHGMLKAVEHARHHSVIGYFDADQSTPLTELPKMVSEMHSRGVQVVLGSRVKMLGKSIQRNVLRHYLGRVFATLVSIVLRIPIYDSQCGAKIFSVSSSLKHALEKPFSSRWAFDVELIGRQLTGAGVCEPMPVSEFVEYPLDEWKDEGESKLSALSMIRTTLELFKIELVLRKYRRKPWS